MSSNGNGRVHEKAPTRTAIAFALACAILLLGLAARAPAQRIVPTADSKFPKLRFADSLTSLNDRCAVSHSKLNPRIKPVYVNGQPVGFC